MTRIDEGVFSIDLPGEWGQVASDDQPGSLMYREMEGGGLLTVMLLSVKPLFAIADQKRLLEDYVEHRATYERGQAPTLRQSATSVVEHDGWIEAAWDGDDTMIGRLQRHRAILKKDVLADFCYEAPGSDFAPFDAAAKEILGSAAVTVED